MNEKDDDYICNTWQVPNGVSYISKSADLNLIILI